MGYLILFDTRDFSLSLLRQTFAMDLDVVAGIHKFIGTATFTTQAAFRSSISSKVFVTASLLMINGQIFATLTVYQKPALIIWDTRNINRVSLILNCLESRLFYKLDELCTSRAPYNFWVCYFQPEIFISSKKFFSKIINNSKNILSPLVRYWHFELSLILII